MQGLFIFFFHVVRSDMVCAQHYFSFMQEFVFSQGLVKIVQVEDREEHNKSSHISQLEYYPYDPESTIYEPPPSLCLL